MTMNIDLLVRKVQGNYPECSPELLRSAFLQVEKSYKEKEHESDRSHIQHTLDMAGYLADLHLDPNTIAAALFHHALKNKDISMSRILKTFGEETANLIEGISRLDDISRGNLREQKAENLRRLILAMTDDVRVVLIRLVEQLFLMRALKASTLSEQKKNARETLKIFAPLANRLGMWSLKGELEDISLQYLEPKKYKEIAGLVAAQQEQREESIEGIVQTLQSIIEEEGRDALVSGRPKNIFSIYKKMKNTQRDFKEIYDVQGVRIIVEKMEDCYAVLDLVHRIWQPIKEEFDDYIAAPKANMYRSLHTTVVGPGKKPVEIQIRTREMHQMAELGVAAHWRYKESCRLDDSIEAKIAFLRGLVAWHQDLIKSQTDKEPLERTTQPEPIYVLSPMGDVIDLPEGSTPLDFAYQIHTEIGHRCRGAKVNGKLVSLDHKLQNGDRVEILTTKRSAPSRDWLNPRLKYVVTHRARRDIRQWFQRQERLNNISQGREILDRELKRSGIKKRDFDKVSHLFGFARLEEFLEAIGRGQIRPTQVKAKLEEREPKKESAKEMATIELPSAVMPRVSVRGMQEFLTRIARCCNPLPGNEIIGFITRSRGLSIHRRDCPNVKRQKETQRLIQVEWGKDSQLYSVPVQVVGSDFKNLLKDMAAIVEAEKANIMSSSVNTSKDDRLYVIIATLEIASVPQLERILKKIKSLPNVIESKRLTS